MFYIKRWMYVLQDVLKIIQEFNPVQCYITVEKLCDPGKKSIECIELENISC